MQSKSTKNQGTQGTNTPAATSTHHTREEDAEYIGIEIMKDAIGEPPSPDGLPPLKRTYNDWPKQAKVIPEQVSTQPEKRSSLLNRIWRALGL